MEFLERNHEIEELKAALDAAATGRGSVVLIGAEAGMGKTRLVNEFTGNLPDRARFLWGACDDLITPRILGPFRDICGQLGGAVAALLDSNPPLGDVYGVMLDALDGGHRSTVVLIEDAHWADAASLDVLKYVGRRIERIPVVLIVTFRDDELHSGHPLRFVLGEFKPDTVRRLSLAPLSREAVERLADQTSVPEDVYELTGGNPFLVTELLSAGGSRVSRNVVDAVTARLRRLSPAARSIADLVAIIPGRCDRRLLDDADIEPAVTEGHERGLLEFDQHAIWFRHELARRAVESAMPARRRFELHKSVAHRLSDLDLDPARIVHHAELGGLTEAVVRFAPVAARQARTAGAHREAGSHYRRVLPHLELMPPAERAELLGEYTTECYYTDDQQDALDAAEQALAGYRELGDQPAEGRMLRWLSRVRWWLGDREGSEAAAAEAISVLEALEPGGDLAMAYSNLAQLHMLSQRLDPAVLWATKAIETAEAVGDKSVLAHALNNLGSARVRAGDLGGRQLLLESLNVALREGLDEHAARAYSNFSWVALDYREYGLAADYLRQGINFSVDHELHGYDYYMVAQRGRMRFERGDWDGAESDARWVMSRPQAPGITTLPALTLLGRVQTRRGDPAASETLAEAWELAKGADEFQRLGPVAVGRAELAYLAGNLDEVRAAIEPAFELALELRQPWVGDEAIYWMWRSGGLETVPETVEPFALQIGGHPDRAAAAWARLGCPYEEAMALADSDREEPLRRALVILDRLGGIPAASLVRRKLKRVGARAIPRGPRSTTRANPAGLTDRQVEVLSLIVEDLTDAEIAERLFVSAKTVGHHVSAILSKLGVTSRREAADQARRLEIFPT